MSRLRGAAAALLSPGASKRYRERKCCNNGAGSPRGADTATLTQTERGALHENEERFKPPSSSLEFQRVLYNLTALRISNAGGQNYTSALAEVTLTSASLSSGPPAAPPAPWVESCSCPPGFAGQFCERCAAGFTREDPDAGALSPCVACNCNRHGSCHPETGKHDVIKTPRVQSF
ncbi:Laminin subunit gamma-1 [Liparis tanakae]|uniref:Laminin subunit gamma-1 n=1 Tax=Liparis tanakae TaxID=230148 RepID=A0A4Z2GCQ5_9TELE|nr:Laminin subunit gamma-1 [Liparis tanakae]